MLFFWGCLARHLTIRGDVGGFMWNPPRTPAKVNWARRQPEILTTGQIEFGKRVIGKAERFYKNVDWAINVSQARFRSVPTFAFGPPENSYYGTQPTSPSSLAKSCRVFSGLVFPSGRHRYLVGGHERLPAAALARQDRTDSRTWRTPCQGARRTCGPHLPSPRRYDHRRVVLRTPHPERPRSKTQAATGPR